MPKRQQCVFGGRRVRHNANYAPQIRFDLYVTESLASLSIAMAFDLAPATRRVMPRHINDSIDAFHRRQLRYALGIQYPRVITNEQLYDVTKCEPWSIITERRRLSWLGHLMRLNPETPARQCFKEALRPVKRKPGRPPMTWITTIQQDLSKRDIHINLRDISAIEKLESMCHDRVGWKARCSMREPRETSPLSSVSAQHVTSDCS